MCQGELLSSTQGGHKNVQPKLIVGLLIGKGEDSPIAGKNPVLIG